MNEPSSNDGETYWKGVVLPSALYCAEVIDIKAEEIDKLQKAENTAMRRILKAPKWTAQAAIRGEIGISNMKARIARSRLLYLRGSAGPTKIRNEAK